MFRLLLILGCLGVTVSAQRAAETSPGGEPVPSGKPNAAAPLPDATALGALALLPKDVAARVARVEGPDGHPFPERWYVLVHDPALPTGLREIVFADGKAVANRGLSQFADRISAEDVMGAAAVSINSHIAAGIAAQFTMHNGKLVGSVRYELFKLDAAPVWRLTCAGTDGQTLGTIVLDATNGSVLSFDGFATAPPQVAVAGSVPVAESAETESEEATSEIAAIENRDRTTPASSKAKPKRRVKTASRRASSPGPIDRMGSFFRKVFH